MKNLKLKIENSKGQLLNATLELPNQNKVRAYAIFAHCFTCSGSIGAARNISKSLANDGIAVLRFDFTGLGSSEGDFKESHFSMNVSDIFDVARYLEKEYEAPAIMIGHSLGGAAAIVAAHELKSIKAVVTIGAPSHVDHVKKLFVRGDSMENEGDWDVNIGGRPFTINKEFVDEFDRIDLLEIVSQLKKPILILHAPHDKIVSINHAQEIFQYAYHSKSFISLDSSDHLLSKYEDSKFAAGVINGWVTRYVPRAKRIDLNTNGRQLVAHINGQDYGYATPIATNRHYFFADEPESMKGTDIGPAPYDLLSASVAACKVITLKMYASRKKWDLQEAFVYVTYIRKKIDNSQALSDFAPDHMNVEFKFIGELDEKQKNRLIEISAKCPVHRTLLNKMSYSTSLIE